MSEYSDYRRLVSDPLEKELRTTIATLRAENDQLRRERDAQRARQEERVRVMEEALRRLADAVGASKVPQTPDEAMVQVLLTVGPALTNARAALGNGGGDA